MKAKKPQRAWFTIKARIVALLMLGVWSGTQTATGKVGLEYCLEKYGQPSLEDWMCVTDSLYGFKVVHIFGIGSNAHPNYSFRQVG